MRSPDGGELLGTILQILARIFWGNQGIFSINQEIFSEKTAMILAQGGKILYTHNIVHIHVVC